MPATGRKRAGVMRVLLVNPNRYHAPPVPPLGLEHVAAALQGAGHDVGLLDLCFDADPVAVLEQRLASRPVDVVGFTIRNLDTALHPGTLCFLDAIKQLVAVAKARGIPVVAGGSGFSIDPEGVARTLGVDHGIAGPGEAAMVRLLEMLARGEVPPRIMDGRAIPLHDVVPGLPDVTSIAAYLSAGAIHGFHTQIGCTRSCSYCIEACKPWQPRNIDNVVAELRGKIDRGITRYHLCDSEFNVALSHAKKVLQAVNRARLGMSWVLYMIPGGIDEDLVASLAASGASLVTLSVASDVAEQRRAGYVMTDVERAARWLETHGIGLAIDLMTGFPGEPLVSIEGAIEQLATIGARSVGVNACFRLYPGTAITRAVLAGPSLRSCTTREIFPGDDLLDPVFFTRVLGDVLERLVAGRPGFRVEGTGQGVNYQRA